MCRQAILDAAQLKADSGSSVRRVVVTGCMAQRYGADLAESIPEADLVVGFQRYGELPASIREALAAPDGEVAQRPKRQRVQVRPGSPTRLRLHGVHRQSKLDRQPPRAPAFPAGVLLCLESLRPCVRAGQRLSSGESQQGVSRASAQVGDATVPFRPEAARHRLTPAHTAYLRVAEGCNHACTFCAIPTWRGRFRSKPWAAAVAEAAALVDSGVQELCLIAEDTNQCASYTLTLTPAHAARTACACSQRSADVA